MWGLTAQKTGLQGWDHCLRLLSACEPYSAQWKQGSRFMVYAICVPWTAESECSGCVVHMPTCCLGMQIIRAHWMYVTSPFCMHVEAGVGTWLSAACE